MYQVWSTARHATHLRFDISSNSLGIRAVQSPKCIVGSGVDCTLYGVRFVSRPVPQALVDRVPQHLEQQPDDSQATVHAKAVRVSVQPHRARRLCQQPHRVPSQFGA
jgi:hypothetical protein